MQQFGQKNRWSKRFLIGHGFVASWVGILLPVASLAQITPDPTLGAENSRITPNATVQGLAADRIDGGAIRGSNLFHSFLEFNIDNGQRVYFANPLGIQNIFSRVTGSNASRINGTLGVDGAANLFLLNPHGILFGPNAHLDIQGAFLATTANSIQFLDGSEFSATNPQSPALLTISVPKGVQYGTTPSGTISSSANLSVGQNLTLSAENLDLRGQLLAGGDLNLQAQNTIKIRDSLIQPFIASAGGRLLLQGNQQVDIFALNHPSSGLFSGGDMILRSATAVGGDTHYWSGGNFRIEQLNGYLGGLFSPYDPVIRASGDVSFANYSGASLHILAGGSVTITGTINVFTTGGLADTLQETVTLSDGRQVNIDGSARPTLDIRAGTTAFGTPGIVGTASFAPAAPVVGGTGTGASITLSGSIFVGQASVAGFPGSPGNPMATPTPIPSIPPTPATPATPGLILVTNAYAFNTRLKGSISLGSVETFGGPIYIDQAPDTAPVAPPLPVPELPEIENKRAYSYTDRDNKLVPPILPVLGCGLGGIFIITGRGGLPPSSENLMSGGAIAIPWVNRSGVPLATAVDLPAIAGNMPLIEAQGMAIAPNGEIRLIAQTSAVTPYLSGFPDKLCSQLTNHDSHLSK